MESRRRERRSGWWFRSPSRRAFWIVKSTAMLGVGSMPQHFERWYSTNTSSFGRDRLDTILCYISIEFWKWARPRNGKNVRHLIECSSTHTCNGSIRSRSHALSRPHELRLRSAKAVPYPFPISSETIVCIWLSVLFCGLYSAATGGARVPILPCFRVPVKYLGVCVSSVRTELWDSVLF